MDYPMAHKTGEEEDQTHDVGIVYARQPFIVCYASNDQTDLSIFEDFIRRTTKALADEADAAGDPAETAAAENSSESPAQK